ncbi:MAG: response regulator transcription factor [Lentisphaerae bacterium]|nr:response regulator transcription factor [Lentisphaerota bacterium]
MDILVIEDDRHLAASLVRGLEEAGYRALTVGTLRDAHAALQAHVFRIILLDLGLPDGDGLELIREWGQHPSKLPVIITTARGELADRLQGLDAGADDYLVKPYALGELLARIRVQLRHAGKSEVQSYRLADLELNVRSRTAVRGGVSIELTPREFDLLAFLFDNLGQVVSRDMLARDVWRIRSRMTSLDNVIDVHVSRLREKIDKEHAVKLLHTVRGVGFMLRDGA